MNIYTTAPGVLLLYLYATIHWYIVLAKWYLGFHIKYAGYAVACENIKQFIVAHETGKVNMRRVKRASIRTRILDQPGGKWTDVDIVCQDGRDVLVTVNTYSSVQKVIKQKLGSVGLGDVLSVLEGGAS